MSETWLGTTNSDYTTAANWHPATVPATPTDTAVFDDTASNQTVDILSTDPTIDVGAWLFDGTVKDDYDVNVQGEVDFSDGIDVLSPALPSIEVQLNSRVVFENGSFGIIGNGAVIEVDIGGVVTFDGKSDAGTARLVTHGGETNGLIDFSGTKGPNGDGKVNAGSIEGDGTINLGANQLTVGSNNRSTIFSGTLEGTATSALIKVGTGLLDLSGNNSFSGNITIEGGAILLGSLDADLGGVITFHSGGAFAALLVDPAALLLGVTFTSAIDDFGRADLVDLPLPFAPGARAHYDPSTELLTVASRGSTVIFDKVVTPAWNDFVVLSNDLGGSFVTLAIVARANHEKVDATHHPRGQPAPTSGPDVIVAYGADDIINGLGGDNTLVARAPGVRLIGGSGADSFVFDAPKASPSGNPDVIVDFHHTERDTIDLYGLFHATHGQPLVYIGHQSFHHYHVTHPGVVGMVRYAGGELQINLDHHFRTEFTIVVHGHVNEGDLIL